MRISLYDDVSSRCQRGFNAIWPPAHAFSPQQAVGVRYGLAMGEPLPVHGALLGVDPARAESIRVAVGDRARVTAAAEAARTLGDPTRLAIAMTLLFGDELCVSDIAWIVERRQNLVSHHLRQLKDARLAVARRGGRLLLYRLTDGGRLLVETVVGRTKGTQNLVGTD